MLVLMLRQGEQLVIGPEIVIHVVEVRGKQTRVAIDAPGLRVHRKPAQPKPRSSSDRES